MGSFYNKENKEIIGLSLVIFLLTLIILKFIF
jgi:hypothetical protein